MTFCNSRVQVAHTENYTLFQCFCFFQNIFIYLLFLTCTHCFIYLFLAVLGLLCCRQAFSGFGDQGLLSVAVHGFSLQQRLLFWACALGTRASVAVVHRFSCSSVYGMFSGQGLNPCPLQWWILICATWEAGRLINVVFHYSHNKITVLCFRRGK